MKKWAYYNDIDPYNAEWIRSLMKRGLIMEGEVDERSICDVQADDLRGFMRVHMFCGIAGWELALRLAGWPDERPVWTGSCPCQPFSLAGKGEGVNDERHLWPVFARLITERRPHVVFGEQVASAIGHGWLDGVYDDMEAEGYACGAAVLGAHSVRAPHLRQRLYWVAALAVADMHGARLDAAGRQGERECGDTGTGCGVMGRAVADSYYPRLDGHGEPGERANECAVGQSCGAGVMGDTELARRQATGRRRAFDAGCKSLAGLPAGRLADPERDGRRADEPGRGAEERTANWRHYSWDRFELVPCRDGAVRRVEPGLFPLAYGLPRSVGAGGSRLDKLGLVAAKDFRRGTLRGYGNAIVPELAAEFIAAYMEVNA